jgi:hypothetical protein
MDYPTAYLNFSKTFADMRTRLLKWLTDNGGTLDTDGNISGLAPNLEIHFNGRNEQLNAILNYATAVAESLNAKSEEIATLKAHIRLLETAEREKSISNAATLDRISELLAWEIQKKHSMDDFRRAIKDTIFFVELGLKRKLIESDERIQLKLHYSKLFLQNDAEARKHFFSRKKILEQASAHITIQNVNIQSVVTSARSTHV